MVKSPYNFVPAPSEGEVFTPDWADFVSHDIPFEDGESGEISVSITAETPIFVRNGHAEGDVMNEFSHIGEGADKRYFIPATSIKGMLRNVLEIMSFSRMKQIDETPFYGLRDMNNTEYKIETNQKNLKAGWLEKNANNWEISEVEHVRVSMEAIEREFLKKNKEIQNATSAIEKYSALGAIVNSDYHLSFVKNLVKTINNQPINYGKLYDFDKSGSFVGNLVLFGNIDNKHYDFVFGKAILGKHKVEPDLIGKMDALEDPLWKFHKSSNRIPVFFKVEGGKVKHFGLSKLYRLNNGNHVGNLNPFKTFKNEKKDLVDLIFGNANPNKKNDSLKGRVFISNAKCLNPPETTQIETRVLSSPKSSYYPFYLRQAGDNGIINSAYNTYINSKSNLAGYKRYPVHNRIKPNMNTDNENIPSEFNPLPEQTSFTCKIRFHNLKKVELGALLSALTFHNHSNYYHTIGGAKPYGFGKVKISIEEINPEYLDTLRVFEEMMNQHVIKYNIDEVNEWIKTNCVKELFAMAANPRFDYNLIYPQLELPNVKARDANEFNNYKKDKKYLQQYSQINGNPKISGYRSMKEIDSDFNLDGVKSFRDIQNKIQTKYNGFVPSSKFDLVVEKIKFVVETDRESRKNLKKPFEDYFAKTPISIWLGQEQAKALYDQLTKP